MTIQQLNYMITISEAGSLNKAAEILHVSQPALSSALQELEKETGITIFRRGVTLTSDGAEFLTYARQVYRSFSVLRDHYGKDHIVRKKFGVSTLHYFFAVKAFVDTVKTSGAAQYDFAVRETTIQGVIRDVACLKSEIGIIFMSSFNHKIVENLLKQNSLSFYKLCDCSGYACFYKDHPLANSESVFYDQLVDYPCLAFEQDGDDSTYYMEHVMREEGYPQLIHVKDRATMTNLMRELNGYTLYTNLICETLDDSDYAVVPYKSKTVPFDIQFQIGYILKDKLELSDLGVKYLEAIRRYLSETKE